MSRSDRHDSLTDRVARRVLMLAVMLLGLSACQSGNPAAPTVPAVATIRVGAESFRVLLTTDELLADAQAALGGSAKRIPNGLIVPGTQVNAGYSWHLEDLSFAELTAELCDGAPSMVERLGTAFGGGRFCPWTARVVAIARQ